MAGRVVIVGSLSMDLVVQTARRPEKGETIRGTGFGMFAGGKGNNQAMAAARSQVDVAMIGRVGADSFGETLLSVLRREKVDVSGMITDTETATGIAHITVDGDGENYIVIAQQSNAKLCEADIKAASHLIEKADVLLMQLEVPMEPLIAAAALAKKNNAVVILNPAPAPEKGTEIPAELLRNVSIIVPNQPECTQLTGIDASTVEGAGRAGERFQQMGIDTTVVTMGEQGALILSHGKSKFVKAFKVKAVDSTAAGDAFCGALAASLARGVELEEAVRVGCAAGGLATTKFGAEPSLPLKSEIDALLKAHEGAAIS